MTRYDPYLEDFDEYEAMFDPMRTDRQARRKRKPKIKHTPKKSQGEIVNEIAETAGLEGGFETTYVPGLFEEAWLLSSLRTFYDQSLITDVLARIRGGKEASVYRCKGHPSSGMELIAAKVYRPRMFRNLRNDKMYRDGREILKADGKAAKKTDHRLMRAVGKKTAYGAEVQHTSWLMYEYTTLGLLYRAGAAVPEPVAAGENAILMSYHGDEGIAATTLNEVGLDREEARTLFDEIMRNVELMLKHDLIHGDLSAYNILYWRGEITLIDFPQVVNSRTNSNARFILQRDITRVCEYFARQGVERDPDSITNYLWNRYMQVKPEQVAADLSRMEVEDE